jgi:hypothetical protein
VTTPDQIDLEWAYVASIRYYALAKKLNRLFERVAA